MADWGGGRHRKPAHFQEKENNLFIFGFLILSGMA